MKVFAISGWSGTGKTTLIEKLISHFVRAQLRVAALKHAHAGFDLETPGKDSARMREAGAALVLVSAPKRWAVMAELRDAAEPTLLSHLTHLQQVDVTLDLVLVEGWKYSALPKLECHRASIDKPLRCLEEASILGVCSDTTVLVERAGVALLKLDDVAAVATFVLAHAMSIEDFAAREAAQQLAESRLNLL